MTPPHGPDSGAPHPRPHRAVAVGVAALVGLSVLLSACGGDDEPDPAPTEADLAGALVAAEDVPEGYSKAEVEDDAEDTEEPFEGTCFADIADFDDLAGEPDVQAKARFVQDDSQLPVEVAASVSYYEDAGALNDAWDSFVGDLSACPGGSATTEDGTTLDLTLDVDDSLTLEGADGQAEVSMEGTVTAQGQTFPIALRAVTVRRENYVSVVGTYALGTDDGGVDVGELATGQFERVRGLTD